MNNIKKIIHIDMDAFYASIEQRDNPMLKGKPVVVGGPPDRRGVVATCSYEARKYGIHSAMPSKIAYKRCSYAIFVPPRFDVYHKVSNQIKEIFYKHTDLVEPLSLDEAFLDVTNNKQNIKYATTIAKMIKNDILKETTLNYNLRIDEEEVIDILNDICEEVAYRAKSSDKLGKTITLKIKYEDFSQITRSISIEHPVNSQEDIRVHVYNLLKNINTDNKEIRLLGVTLSNLIDSKDEHSNITIFEYLENLNKY